MILSELDKYGLARALAGLPPHPDVAMHPLIAMFARNYAGRKPTSDDVETLRGLFGHELIKSVFQVDPNGAPPVMVAEGYVKVPALPDGVALTRAQQDHAMRVGGWLGSWMKYAQSLAGMTDPLFLESAGLWLIGLVCARRVVLALDFQRIYNNHYMLWVAPTTFYRKSTGLRVAENIARDVAPHLLLAGQSSPEMLLFKLAGQRTPNFDDLDDDEQNRENLGMKYAGQRAFIADEMSKLFSKKYMEGLPEVLMEMAEAPDLMEQEYKSVGKLVVRNAGLSLLFATTPERLRRVFGDGEWEDGLLARFSLLTPTTHEVKRTPSRRMSDDLKPPQIVVDVLKKLVSDLPQPPHPGALDGNKWQGVASVGAKIDDAALEGFNRYADALHDMVSPSSGLDYRLRGVYGRLPVHGLRVALSLAASDWALKGGAIQITEAHWFRAQLIVEKWRASAHRLLAEVSVSLDQQTEEKVLAALRQGYVSPPTKHTLFRQVGGIRTAVYSAIDSLVDGGVVEKIESGGPTRYQMAGAGSQKSGYPQVGGG